ncbi:hypothetical protein CI102_13915 [Trichoderma harzianum]|uniref:Uncharacterized protein n=1 Tax=Trichoderma harzianum CBS 226.95 TaxID=983964 RepID=A0A2T4AKM7_TRIHA|nr:hypothetical protein M431DRAFT_344921 [Trichoderma harzianum CBS 226.95]PKK42100.1 hypothetical protein CI102_13915 [Trichoderma harzianum]PTB57597.1 hypothetical protein M431DRAFT_344921 [Trichoderma harzianum CBS 226.95]
MGVLCFACQKKLWFLFLISFFLIAIKHVVKGGTGVDNWLRFGQIGMEWFFTRWKTGSNLGRSRRMGRLYIGINSTSKRNTR